MHCPPAIVSVPAVFAPIPLCAVTQWTLTTLSLGVDLHMRQVVADATSQLHLDPENNLSNEYVTAVVMNTSVIDLNACTPGYFAEMQQELRVLPVICAQEQCLLSCVFQS